MKTLAIILVVVGSLAFVGAVFGLGILFFGAFGLSKEFGTRLFQVCGIIFLIDVVAIAITEFIKKYI